MVSSPEAVLAMTVAGCAHIGVVSVVDSNLVLEVHGFGSVAMPILNMGSRVFAVLLFIFAKCVVSD